MVNYFLIALCYFSVEIGEDSLKLFLTEEVLTYELIYLLISG